jgi:outer membrane protein assembly factor BamB
MHFSLRCGVVAFVLTSVASFGGGSLKSQDDWPQWRGPSRDGNSPAKGLLKEWPEEGPPVAWQVDGAGVGYASLAVNDGRIYTQGDLDGIEQVICLDLRDGSTLWAVQPAQVAEELAKRVDTEFEKIDKNGDGRLDELEALARFGWDWNKHNQASPEGDGTHTKQRSAALFSALDKDEDGKLAFDEAGESLRDGFDKADAEDKSADAAELAENRTASYMQLDKDGDEQLSKEEVKGTAAERHFGRIDVPDPTTEKGDELLSAEEIKAALLKHEPGRDGLVSQEELAALYVQGKATGDDELKRDELRAAIGGYRSGMGDGPRGTPAVDGDRVYALGANGDLSCLTAATGETLWHVNLVRDFAGSQPGAGYCESPLVAGELVIVSPGGKQGTVAALDKMTGEKVWQSGEMTEQPDYASAIAAEIGGIPQVVQFARESVFGLSLDDGKLLWRYTAPASPNANCCTPIVVGDLVFASSGYGTGGGLAKIVNTDSGQEAEEVYFQKKMACHHGGMVKVGDHVYSNAEGPLICMDFKTGKVEWQARSVGKGSLIAAEGMLYLVSEGNELALVEATPEKYREHGRFKSPTTKKPVLSHPALADGLLLVREQETLTAYDVRGREPRLATPAKDAPRKTRR